MKVVLVLGALLAVLPRSAVAQVQEGADRPAQALEPIYPALPPPPAPSEARTAPRVADSAAPGAYGHQRGSWYIGFGLGGGDGRVTVGGRDYGFSALLGRGATTSAFNIRAGVTVTPRLLVGFDGSALGGSTSRPTEDVQLNVYDAGVMFFPWREGFYLRGAAGVSNIAIKSDGPVVGGTGTLWGTNLLVGAGYAWWLGQSFNLTFGVDYRELWHSHRGPDGVTRAGGWSACLGFDWY